MIVWKEGDELMLVEVGRWMMRLMRMRAGFSEVEVLRPSLRGRLGIWRLELL